MKRGLIVIAAALTACAPALKYAGETPINGGAVYDRAEPDIDRSSRKLLIKVLEDGSAEIEAATVGPVTFRRYTAVRQRYDTANGPWEPVMEKIVAERRSDSDTVPAIGVTIHLSDSAGNQWQSVTDVQGRARVDLTAAPSLGETLAAWAEIGGRETRADARIPSALRH